MSCVENGNVLPKKPRFFKPLLPGFSEKLIIPRLFLKHIIPKKIAKLWTSHGKTWSVKIQGNAPDLYFGQGWEQFTEANDLDVGYFLIFCHEGDMNFSVIVLDNTCCEKEYMTHIAMDEEDQNLPKIQDALSLCEIKSKRKIRNGEERTGARKKARNRKVNNRESLRPEKEPPKYMVTLQLRNLDGHYYIYIPVEFKENTGITGKKKMLFLKDPKSELWPVEIAHSTKNRTLLTRGWKDFCVSNNLRPGDDCEFQLAPESKKNGKVIMQVRIFKKSETQRLEAIKNRRTSGSNTKDMTFWHTVRVVGRTISVLQIPNAFVAATGILEKQRLKASLRDQNGLLFDVNLSRATRNRVIMVGGWRSFVTVNKLKAGDVCEFKLEPGSNDNPLFDVKILKEPPNSDNNVNPKSLPLKIHEV